MSQHAYDEQEMDRRRALIDLWTPRQRKLALHFLSTAVPESFDLAARNEAFEEATELGNEPKPCPNGPGCRVCARRNQR